MRVNTLSKLTFADAARFDGLVKDTFPRVDIREIEYPELLEAIREVYVEMGLVYVPQQVKKMLEFYEQLRQRMGVVVVGPAGTGKSVVWRVLLAAMERLGGAVRSL